MTSVGPADRPPHQRSAMALPSDAGADPVPLEAYLGALAALPVLILTARGQERERRLADARGASIFMTKPFANAEIVANLRKLAGG